MNSSSYDYSGYYSNGGVNVSTADSAAMAGIASMMFVMMAIYAVLIIIMVVSHWKIFAKAGKPGWASIIPIYNVIVLLEIIGRPTWWVVLYFIPFANIIVALINVFDLSKSFGKEAGFGILLVLLPIVGFPMLAFGSSKYVGPAVTQA